MPHFQLNGKKRDLTFASIEALITDEGLSAETSIAVAVNDHVVPRQKWSATVLSPGDTVEIVKPFSGG